MVGKPQNHVTRALEDIREVARVPEPLYPDIPLDLLERLEADFPPRCYDHNAEKLEDHIKYSGMVELVAFLRDKHEEQKRTDADLEEDT